MNVVHLYLDYTNILKPAPDHILVEAIRDYTQAYTQMAEAIHAGQPLTIIVRHPTCAAWLQAAQEKYSSEHIQAGAAWVKLPG